MVSRGRTGGCERTLVSRCGWAGRTSAFKGFPCRTGELAQIFLVEMLHFYFVVQPQTQDASPASLEPFTSCAQRVLVTRVTSVLFPLLCLSLGLSPHDDVLLKRLLSENLRVSVPPSPPFPRRSLPEAVTKASP